MLARTGGPAAGGGGWSVEPKWDGFRIGVGVSPDLPLGYRVTTRSGSDITESLPEAVAAVAPGVELVIDGEVVAGAGRADDFYQLAGALARRGRPLGTLTVVAFDLLWVDGHDITGLPWVQRRRLLEQLHFGEHMVAQASWRRMTPPPY